MSSKDLLPPRRRNWKEGQSQVGIFIRDETGETVTLVANKASPKLVEAIWAILHDKGMK